MDTTFSFELRVLACGHCGAPLDVPVHGGTVRCAYCGTQSQIEIRDTERWRVLPEAQLPEAHRLHQLRAQDGRPLPVPRAFAELAPHGEIAPYLVDHAVTEWLRVSAELRLQHNPDATARLLFLTLELAHLFLRHQERMRERAMLESALDVLYVPSHRQVVLGQLCRAAIGCGDLAAADRWLSLCTPYSADLFADSTYRLSSALLATARGEPNTVLAILGRQANEIPIMDSLDKACTVVRANAWERLGHGARAHQMLLTLMKTEARGYSVIKSTIQRYPTLGLCAQSFREADARHAAWTARSQGRASHGYLVPLWMGILCLVGGALCVAVAQEYLPDLLDLEHRRMDLWLPGAIGLLIGVITTPIGLAFWLKARRVRYLYEYGVDAWARIERFSGTGLRVNGVPQMEFFLTVYGPDGQAYHADTALLMAEERLQRYRPGAMVPVIIDPDDPGYVVIDTQPAAASARWQPPTTTS